MLKIIITRIIIGTVVAGLSIVCFVERGTIYRHFRNVNELIFAGGKIAKSNPKLDYADAEIKESGKKVRIGRVHSGVVDKLRKYKPIAEEKIEEADAFIKTEKIKTAQGEPEALESDAVEPGAPELGASEPRVPEAGAPELVLVESGAPIPEAVGRSALQPVTLMPGVSGSAILEPEILGAPKPEIPEAGMPEAGTPEAGMPEEPGSPGSPDQAASPGDNKGPGNNSGQGGGKGVGAPPGKGPVNTGSGNNSGHSKGSSGKGDSSGGLGDSGFAYSASSAGDAGGDTQMPPDLKDEIESLNAVKSANMTDFSSGSTAPMAEEDKKKEIEKLLKK